MPRNVEFACSTKHKNSIFIVGKNIEDVIVVDLSLRTFALIQIVPTPNWEENKLVLSVAEDLLFIQHGSNFATSVRSNQRIPM